MPDLCLHLRNRPLRNDLGQADILEYAQAVQKHKVLEHKPHTLITDLCKPFLLKPRQILACQQDAPVFVRNKAGNAV